MTKHPNPLPAVFRKEPLMRLIAATGVSPVRLGILFFVLISVTLSTWAYLEEPQRVEALPTSALNSQQGYLSFSENISWSLSIIFLFPFVVSLTLIYYKEIPKLFDQLQYNIQNRNGRIHDIEEFYLWLDRRFNCYWITILIICVTFILNIIYFYQIIKHGSKGWMINGDGFSSLSLNGLGLTPVGLYAAVIQIVLIYWVLNLLWRGAVLAWGLHEFFNERNFPVTIQPLHPDRCCGLRKIGDVAMLLNVILFLLGIYISLKVIDKIVIQGSFLGADIGNPIMLGGYLIIAPLLFFSPLGAAHRQMSDAKEKFLKPASQKCEQLASELANVSLDNRDLTAIKTISALEAAISSLHKKIAVWPFDFRSLQAFVTTIVFPILPIILPFAAKLIFGT